MEEIDIEAVLSDPEAIGEAIKKSLSCNTNDFLDEMLICVLRCYFKGKAKLEINNA